MACDFHGAGFGSPYGMQWKEFTPKKTYADKGFQTSVTEGDIQQKAKPVFSKAASRASTIAKIRVKNKSEAKRKELAKNAVAKTALKTD